MDERLKRLIARREQAATKREDLLAKRKAIVDIAEEESRDDLTDEEDVEFRGFTDQIKTADDEIRQLDERISELSDEQKRSQQLTEGQLKVKRALAQVTREARTYEHGNGNSYLKDLTRISLGLDGNGDSRARLERHANEVRTDKEFRALTTTDAEGGYFVPPLWLLTQWAELARAGRATANVVSQQELPPGTDSINIPKVTAGTTTAIQDGQNTMISNQDIVDDVVNAPVRTIAGEQDIAIQLLEQSPVNFDEVIFQDLLADYATRLDTQVISGTGSNGQVRGLRNTSGITTITWTEADPTVAKLYGQLADAVQRVHTTRFLAPQVIVMHPRRWAWFLAALDTTQRPLVLPAGNQPQNATGILTAVASEQVVGTLHGLPVVTDPNIPVNVNDNQDVILVMRASDHILWESSIRTRVLASASGVETTGQGVGGRTLTTTLQVYGYLAFTAGRYPQSTVLLTGTGLTTPSFDFDDGS